MKQWITALCVHRGADKSQLFNYKPVPRKMPLDATDEDRRRRRRRRVRRLSKNSAYKRVESSEARKISLPGGGCR